MYIKKCYVCKKIFITKTKSTKKYCSTECNKKSRKISGIFKECELCGKVFEVPKSNLKQRFCSIKCQGEWQKTQVGKLNHKYKRVEMSCEWCGVKYDMQKYLLKNFKHHFCSEKCRREWYAKDWSQRDEWKKESSTRAVQMLENDKFNKTATSPQLKINSILEKLNIDYQNEYNCDFYAIDNALFYNNKIFFIEVMGTFWHCDIRKYKSILYSKQYDRIIADKSKKTYIENKYNTKILYLWEQDIENFDLCEKLIINFINDKLSFYHSSNYYLENDEIKLNKNLTNQYIECDSSYINEHINFIKKGKIRPQNQKQPDKWIVYYCEFCGKEKEMLKSHYKKAKHHYCSSKCRIEGMKKI